MSDFPHKEIFIGKYKKIRVNDLEKLRINEAFSSIGLGQVHI